MCFLKYWLEKHNTNMNLVVCTRGPAIIINPVLIDGCFCKTMYLSNLIPCINKIEFYLIHILLRIWKDQKNDWDWLHFHCWWLVWVVPWIQHHLFHRYLLLVYHQDGHRRSKWVNLHLINQTINILDILVSYKSNANWSLSGGYCSHYFPQIILVSSQTNQK